MPHTQTKIIYIECVIKETKNKLEPKSSWKVLAWQDKALTAGEIKFSQTGT